MLSTNAPVGRKAALPVPDRGAGMQPAHADSVAIEKSWERCRGFGLDEGRSPDLSRLDRAGLGDALDANHMLAEHARPIMETLHEQIAHTDSMVVLTDARALVLHSLGDDEFLQRTDRVALKPGASWCEESKGTNAIGTAAFEEAPMLVHGPQHFFAVNRFLTCSAAPVVDPHGTIAGILDVTGDHRGYHRHTMALVRISARMVENGLFAGAFPDGLTLRFHSRPEFIGTLAEGLVVFAEDGRFLAANASALVQLGLRRAQLRDQSLATVFGARTATLLTSASRGERDRVFEFLRPNDETIYARADAGARIRAGARVFVTEALRHGEPSPRAQAGRSLPGRAPAHDITLAALDIGDPRLRKVIDRVKRVAGRDISILIQGETGTGKELFARAIHNLSQRRTGPFIAVNCASIPDGLIESELFGYEEGAFTGARRHGAPGKIQLASGGTLFLDEIGDMPVNLQVRLLRVLQERVVVPLGSSRAQPVDVAVVCATNCRLKERIRAGQFREDLYYRLNGLLVTLPPLRERTDLRALVGHVLDTQVTGGARYALSEDVMAMFERHPWPGNCRQLANLLRTATVLAGDCATLEREHLPEDFLEDLDGCAARDRTGGVADRSDGAPATTARHEAAWPGGLRHIELEAIRACVVRCGGNMSLAARTLGIGRNTLYRKLRQAGQAHRHQPCSPVEAP
jgi:transcriptional regulator of acetoin/glycerol metabolism